MLSLIHHLASFSRSSSLDTTWCIWQHVWVNWQEKFFFLWLVELDLQSLHHIFCFPSPVSTQIKWLFLSGPRPVACCFVSFLLAFRVCISSLFAVVFFCRPGQFCSVLFSLIAVTTAFFYLRCFFWWSTQGHVVCRICCPSQQCCRQIWQVMLLMLRCAPRHR